MNVVYLVIGALGTGLLIAIVFLLSRRSGPGDGGLAGKIELLERVQERGERLLGSVHAAYFYKSLSLIGEWQYGYGSYATAALSAE